MDSKVRSKYSNRLTLPMSEADANITQVVA